MHRLMRLGAGAAFALALVSCGDNIEPSSTGLLVITAGDGLQTTEAGGTATFTVALAHKPGAKIDVDLTSSNIAEGTIEPASIAFDSSNWDKPVTVTLTGVNDLVDDGDQPFTVHVDAGYYGSGDVDLTNLDNDTAGITVSPTDGLQTSEAGTTATFTVVLDSQPTGEVTIPVASDKITEGTVSVTSLTFNAQNWNAARTVTVTGVDDSAQDGNVDFAVVLGAATSADGKYMGIDAADVSATNLDDDTANFLVTPTTGLTTTEGLGSSHTATFSVRLLTQPTANVTVSVSSDDTTEGTVSPSTLTFTPLDWDAPQTVTVTGADDAVADGAVTYHAVLDNIVTVDTNYSSKAPSDVTLSNLDDDSAGVLVTLTTPAETTEAGGQAQFEVVLLSQPTADVTIPVASSDTSEGTVAITQLVFTTTNWDAPQTVTVTGVDDATQDGDQVYAITLGSDAGYVDTSNTPVDPMDVSLTNRDNDSANVQLSRTSGLVTDETGASDSFTIVLLAQPSADVTISYSSDDTTEATVSPPSPIVFTTSNWNVPQTITAVGVDDLTKDGNQPFTISLTAASSDANYDNFAISSVTGTNLDNDAAAIRVSPLRLDVSEFGDTDTFDIVLTTAPLGTVTIPLSVSDSTEISLGNTSNVTFTTLNWNVPQTVTVKGLNDNLIDGQQQSYVITGPATSTDPAYSGLDADDVLVFNFDDESPGVYVQGHNLLKTQEGTNQPQYIRMRLTIAPTAPVTCTVISSDTTEVSVTPGTFTFDATNFSVLQTITVRGVDDLLVDGDQLVTIVTQPCTSADPVYNLFDPRNIQVLNRDNE